MKLRKYIDEIKKKILENQWVNFNQISHVTFLGEGYARFLNKDYSLLKKKTTFSINQRYGIITITALRKSVY